MYFAKERKVLAPVSAENLGFSQSVQGKKAPRQNAQV